MKEDRAPFDAFVDSLRGWMNQMLGIIHRRRIVLNLPFWLGGLMAFGFDLMHVLTLRLIDNKILTRDQVRQLQSDNVVSADARGLSDLGIVPTATDVILPEYLWRFRPSGQYDAIKASAKKLKA